MNQQIIPFPLPPYLASYFANKITTEKVISNDGSLVRPFNIKRNSPFGNYIIKCLSKQNKPSKVGDNITFFIKVEDYKTTQSPKIANSRYSFVALSDQSIKDITNLFKSVFEENLKNYVAGAEDLVNNFVDRKRGIQNLAIENFCKKNNVIYTNKNLSAWKKMIYRNKLRVNTSKSGVL